MAALRRIFDVTDPFVGPFGQRHKGGHGRYLPPAGSTLVVRRHRGEVKRCHRDRRPFCSRRASGTAESTRSKRRSKPQLQPPPKEMRRQIRKRLGRQNGGGERAPVPPAPWWSLRQR